MSLKVPPPAPEFHTNRSHDSHAPKQLRLPLMARERGCSGTYTRNIAAVEALRLFLVMRSHTPAKLVAKAIGSRWTRIHNEDEGRVQMTGNLIVARFADLSEDDREAFIEKLRAVSQ